MTSQRINQFPGTCDRCGTSVPAETGRLVNSRAYASRHHGAAPDWKVRCRDEAACKRRAAAAREQAWAEAEAAKAPQRDAVEAEAARQVARLRERYPRLPALATSRWVLPGGAVITVRKVRGGAGYTVAMPHVFDGYAEAVGSRAEAELLCLRAYLEAEEAPLTRAWEELAERVQRAALDFLTARGEPFTGQDVADLAVAAQPQQRLGLAPVSKRTLRAEGLAAFERAAAALDAITGEEIAAAVRAAGER